MKREEESDFCKMYLVDCSKRELDCVKKSLISVYKITIFEISSCHFLFVLLHIPKGPSKLDVNTKRHDEFETSLHTVCDYFHRFV